MKTKYMLQTCTAIFALMVLASIWAFSKLPRKVPIHWNYRGEVDGFGSPLFVAVFMPAMTLGLLLLFLALPKLSPRGFEIELFRGVFNWIVVVFMAFMGFVHVLMIANALSTISFPEILCGAILVLFGLLGPLMAGAKRNFYVGIRTLWTIASDRVWGLTHRLAALTTVAGSVVGLLLLIVGLNPIIAVCVGVSGLLVPAVYSYFAYKSDCRYERFS